MEPVLAFITLAGSNPRSSLYSAVCATWLPWKDASASADGAAAESSTADAMAPVDDGDRGGDRGQRGRTWPTVASFFFLGRIDNNAITSLSDGIGRAGWTETQLCAKGVGGMEIRGTGTPRWRSRRAIPVTETHRTRRAVASGFAVFGSLRGKGTHRPRRMTSCCFRRRRRPRRGRRRGRRGRG